MRGLYHGMFANGGLNFDVNVVSNCATNCEFQLQLAHSQLQLQLQLGKNAYLINYHCNYLNN